MLERRITELWSTDGQPWIAANVYLREMAPIKNWSETTISRKAADLRHFAQWLSAEGRTFWDPEVRLGGKLMVAFRDSLFGKRAKGNRSRGQALQASTIRQIMREAFDLCSYWKAGAESIRGSRTLLGKSRWKRKALPPAFSLRVIPTRRGEQSLTLDEVKAVWAHLYEDCRPPRRWGRELSKAEWQLRMAFWARDCMIWALLISTGLRRGEVPGVMLHDVKAYEGAGWWVHLVDPREHLGGSPKRASVASYGAKFKTGSFALTGDNTVVLTRSDDHDDSAVSMFLAFLEADMHEKPGNVRPVPQDLLARARILVEGIAVDLEAPLNPDDS